MLLRFDVEEPITNFVREFLADEYAPAYSYQPAIDIVEQENESTIVAELPGVKKEDISISVENNWLTLKGERKVSGPSEVKNVLHSEIVYQPFVRSIKLPHAVDVNGISAELANGILKITLPKAEQFRPRTIQVQ